MAKPIRVLIVAHGHPAAAPGGGEIAAHNLFRALNDLPGHEAYFLARTTAPGSPPPSSGRFRACGEREVLFRIDAYDPFRLSSRHDPEGAAAIAEYLRALRPDVVHFHHVLGLGVELLAVVRRTLPEAVLAVTFHEYLAICHHHGQMIQTDRRGLCHAATPAACARCFPAIPPARFARRAAFLRTLFATADLCVAPSRFLVERLIAFGLPAARCVRIENGIDSPAPAPLRPLGPDGRRGRFAFFGQINPFKGVDVLLDAVGLVPATDWTPDARVLIHGGNLDRQDPLFQAAFHRRLEQGGDRVRFCGGYHNQDLPKLMASVDWVVVPSIWWENAPVVIQEAFHHRRPVICSGIGGMAEMVEHGRTGLHARPNNPADLADRIAEALRDPTLHARLSGAIAPPSDLPTMARRHADAYAAVRTAPSERLVRPD